VVNVRILTFIVPLIKDRFAVVAQVKEIFVKKNKGREAHFTSFSVTVSRLGFVSGRRISFLSLSQCHGEFSKCESVMVPVSRPTTRELSVTYCR